MVKNNTGVMDKRFFILFLLFILAISIFVSVYTVNQLKSLPSPIHGGDYYYQLGGIVHIMKGGNPLEHTSLIKGITFGYLPVYGSLVALFGNFLGLSPLKSVMYFTGIVFFLSSVISYFLFYFLTKNQYISLFLLFLLTGLNKHPIFKYTPFTLFVLVPLYFLVLFFLYNDEYKKKNVYSFSLGLVNGLLSISHTIYYIVASFISFIFFLALIKRKKITLRGILLFAMPFVLLSMIYFYRPLIEAHLKISYDRLHIDFPDFANFDVAILFFKQQIKKSFFSFSSFDSFLINILFWLSVVFAVKKRFSNKSNKLAIFSLLVMLSVFFITFSYFFTEPLFHIHFAPPYCANFFIFAKLFFIAYFLSSVQEKFFAKSYFVFLFFFILMSLFCYEAYCFSYKFGHDRWFKIGKNPIPQIYSSSAQFFNNHFSVHDVVLTTKEIGFALNALTGCKLITSRWAQQSDPYVNLPLRDLELATILYTNNDLERLKLLRKYNVSLLYWNINWISSEFRFKKNKLISFYDPLMAFDSSDYREFLKKNNIKYFLIHWWADPSAWRPEVRKFDLIVVSPNNYRSFTKPWHPSFDKFLSKIWSLKDKNGNEIAAFYKVSY